MISFENVSYTYKGGKDKVLKDINFKIEEGETILLVGESGSGKSTITRLINGIATHLDGGRLEGSVSVGGDDILKLQMWELAGKVGSVFQNPKSQFFNTNTSNEVVFALENMGKNHEEMSEALKEAASSCGIEPLLNRSIFELSGGEKQRVAFASAYAPKPEVYVLDEPSANLDMKSIDRIREIILNIKKQGKTVVLAEHRIWYSLDFADRIFYMKDGFLKRIFSRDEFSGLSDNEIKDLGLRSRKRPELEDIEKETSGVFESGGGLVVKGLKAKIKKRSIWENVEFMFDKGRVGAITGDNGSGKTSLALVLSGLIKEKQGDIYFENIRVNAKKRRRLNFMIMQDVNNQLFSDSLINEVMLGNDTSREKALSVLEKMGLKGLEERHPLSLSGGQKQRLAIADGILSGKKILIFDEPTSGLDYKHMIILSEILKELASKGTYIIVITHDVEFIKACKARLIEWHGG